MTPHQALASVTLAQLYATQGHLQKALNQVEELLARDPADGEALALRERLTVRKGARLELRVDREILLRWQVPETLRRLHPTLSVVLAVTPRGRLAAPHYLSGPATGSRGEMHLPFPYVSGSAIACLATLSGERRAFTVLAGSESASW